MLFLFKDKKITVDAFTYDPLAYEFHQIKSSNNFIPDWWKKTEKEVHFPNNGILPSRSLSTVKRCTGVIEYMGGNNFIIPMWSDLNLDYNNSKYCFEFSYQPNHIEVVENEARGGLLKNYINFKLFNVWKLSSKSNVKFVFNRPFYNKEYYDEVIIPPGIIDFKYQNSTEFNIMLIRSEETKKLRINAGDPLIHLIPLTERKVEIKCHLVSEYEFNRRYRNHFSFFGNHKKKKNIIDKIENKSKCPFGF